MSNARSRTLAYVQAGKWLIPLNADKAPDYSLLPQKVDSDGCLLWVTADGKETTVNTGRAKKTFILEESNHPQNYSEAEVKSWFARDINRPYGIRTGKVNGFIAVDLDSEAAHSEAVKRGLPVTRTHRTGRRDAGAPAGGWHVLYKYDPAIAAGKPFAGCDIKTDGGYIVGDGSRHASGALYLLAVVSALSTAPDWLIQKPVENPPVRTVRDHVNFTGSALDEVLHYLSYPAIQAKANESQSNWIAALRILRDSGGSISDAHWLSSLCPDKYAISLAKGEIEKAWEKHGKKVASGSKLNVWDRECNGRQATRDWYRLQRERSAAPAQDVALDDKSLPAVASVPEPVADVTGYLDHFIADVCDTWQAWLRRLGRHCDMTAYVWNEAVKAGLFTAASAERLALAAEQLGHADPERHETAVTTYQKGLDRLLSEKVLTTCKYNNSPCGQNFSAPPNEHGVLYLWQPFEYVFGVIYEWAQPRLEQLCNPGYQTPDPDPEIESDRANRRVMAHLRPDHFTGQAGKSQDEAIEIAADIAQHYPDEDINAGKAKRRYRRKIHDLFNALQDSQDCTPLAPGAKFHTYTEFDKARYEGKVRATASEEVTLTQWDWCQFLGVSKGTLINLRKDTPLENIVRIIDDIPLSLGGNVEKQVRDICKSKKGFLTGMRVYDPVAQTSTPCKYNAQEAQRRLDDGCGVYPLVQVASKTRINPDKQEKPAKPRTTPNKPRTTPYFAPWHGNGFSAAWLWSQIVLRLIRHGYEECAINDLSLPDVIALARQPRLAKQQPANETTLCTENTPSESETPVYTPAEKDDGPELDQATEVKPATPAPGRYAIKPITGPGFYETNGGFMPDEAAARATMEAYYASPRGQEAQEARIV